MFDSAVNITEYDPAMEHYETAPEDRIPFHQKLIYGSGAFVNNLLAAGIGSMVIVLNIGLGMNPALVGLLGALPRLVDAFTDPLMGFISDKTRSRWGRRRPYIFVGAIASGVIFALLWQLPSGQSESFYFWFFLGGSLLFFLAYTIFATPWVALGYELTPDYHERTRLMGTQFFIGSFAYIVSSWFLYVMQNGIYLGDLQLWQPDNIVDGAAGLAIMIGAFVVAIGILPAVLLRERQTAASIARDAQDESGRSISENAMDFFRGFSLTLRSKPFLKLCIATFFVFNGFMLVSSLQNYTVIYYIFGGDTELATKYIGYEGTLRIVSSFAVIVFATWLSTRIGKRRAFFITIGISILGYSMKWFCYNPQYPWLMMLPAPFLSFGLGGLFTLVPSMIADVVDFDELQSHERREGMYGSIFWWVVKLGMALALALGGFLLNATGFDVALEGNQAVQTITQIRLFDAFLPVFFSGIAIWAIATFTITEEKAHEIRTQLEARRGTA